MSEQQNKPEDQVEAAVEEALAESVEAIEEAAEEVIEEITEEEDALSALQNELVRAQEEVAKAQDQALRAVAEAQNIKRRAQQDVEKAHKFALDKFVENLLPVVDSLEQGLKSTEGADPAVREGMELTLKLLVDTLAKHNVEQLNPVGEPLDPNFHQAMTMVPNPAMEPNTVMDVVQKGYLLNGRVVRPAMVVVSKAP
ncbi:nucleotide exchange factor GrpE [Parendozoicomonas haliclonae]|uniref:Protein GrpE n=1 Tax=Parendozoicomonas haliclonae TaxID=1960125 RepID=A0A1X7AFW9_9GAMM|nr:nucleotide exchange factor GrpE [Parendozoicomonas haliclonae]SMA31537.1 heat shock protein GrpE [Parendozoicomonas haliclonae]